MEDEAYRRAQADVQKIRGFYIYFGIYILFNILLFTINAVTAWGEWWFCWITIFWGAGILMYAASVWGGKHFLGKEWEDKKIQQVLEKEKKSGCDTTPKSTLSFKNPNICKES